MWPGAFKEPPDVCSPFFSFFFRLTVQIEQRSMSLSVSVSSSLLELVFAALTAASFLLTGCGTLVAFPPLLAGAAATRTFVVAR
jgi:hypothetical protein